MNPNNPYNGQNNQNYPPQPGTNGYNQGGYPSQQYQGYSNLDQNFSQFSQNQTPQNLNPQNYPNNGYGYGQNGQSQGQNEQPASWYPQQKKVAEDKPSSVDDYLNTGNNTPHITPGQTMGNGQYAVDYLGLSNQANNLSKSKDNINIGPISLPKPILFAVIGIIVFILISVAVVAIIPKKKSTIATMDLSTFYTSLTTAVVTANESDKLLKDADLRRINSSIKTVFVGKQTDLNGKNPSGFKASKVESVVKKEYKDGQKSKNVASDASDAMKIGRSLEESRLNNRYDSGYSKEMIALLGKIKVNLDLMQKRGIYPKYAEETKKEVVRFKNSIQKKYDEIDAF